MAIREVYKPAPSIVDSKQRSWKIRGDDAAPRMSFQSETVWVPLGSTQVDVDIRAHELAHIRWTPEDAYEQLSEYPSNLVNAVEDGRINSLLEQCEVRAPDYSEHPIYDEEKVRASMARNPLIAAMMRYCAEGTGWKARAQEILEDLYPDDAAWINAQAETLSVANAEFDAVASVVRETYETYCTEQPDEPEEDEPDEGDSIEGESDGDPGETDDGESGESGQDEGDDESDEDESGQDESDEDDGSSDEDSGGSGDSPGDEESDAGGSGSGTSGESDQEGDGPAGESDEPDTGAGSGMGATGGSSSDEEQQPGDDSGTPAPSRPKPEAPLDPDKDTEVDTDAAPWKATEALKEKEEETEDPVIGDVDGPDIEINDIDEKEAAAEGVKGLWELRDSRSSKLSTGTAPWCDVHLKETALTQTLPRAHRAAKRGEYYGRVPKYPHRMATDRKVFSRKQGGIKYPGTVLVDVSGSMALTGKDIGRVLDSYPTAEMRDYSACFAGNFGELRTVAKDGKRLTDKELNKGRACSSCRSNGIDGPALRWLATQPRPRFWISDGKVNGSNQRMTQNLLDECAKICAENRIIRVGSPDEFIKKYC